MDSRNAHEEGGQQHWRGAGRLTRPELIDKLTLLVAERSKQGASRVAVDGVDAAGKTILSDELADSLGRSGVAVLRASIDGFHHPASIRHRNIETHPAHSYYEDSFDYESLRRLLLDPLGPNGDRRVRLRVFDFRTDQPTDDPVTVVRSETVLLFDGVFLLRPGLAECWDLSVYLHIEPGTSLLRGMDRDHGLFGTREAAEHRYRLRYLPGQELYKTQVGPDQRADVLIDNTDPSTPRVLRWFDDVP